MTTPPVMRFVNVGTVYTPPIGRCREIANRQLVSEAAQRFGNNNHRACQHVNRANARRYGGALGCNGLYTQGANGRVSLCRYGGRNNMRCRNRIIQCGGDRMGQAINFDIELSAQSSYLPFNVNLNGFRNGCFAQVNLNCNTHVDLRATIKKSCSSRPSCRLCTESGFDPIQRISCFAQGCSCYGTTVSLEGDCTGTNLDTAKAAYDCTQMNQTLVFPAGAMATMTAYDLDTDANGHYTEQLTVQNFMQAITPLRGSITGNEYPTIPRTIFENRMQGMFTGSAVDLPNDIPTSPTQLTDDQASKGVQFYFQPENGFC